MLENDTTKNVTNKLDHLKHGPLPKHSVEPTQQQYNEYLLDAGGDYDLVNAPSN
jgi:hypothetical protein